MSNNKGFTLIEMMIVIVIIGIITSTAYPSLSRATDISKENERAIHEKVANKALKEHYALTGTYPDSDRLVSDLAEHTGVRLNTKKYNYVYTPNESNKVTELHVDLNE